MRADPAALRRAADALDEGPVWEIAADAITAARDAASRHPQDLDSGELLDALITALRTAADGP
jgi:hypothetical protein